MHQCRVPGDQHRRVRYPLKLATEIAVRTVRAFAAEAGSLETVHFACFSEEALRAYTALGVAEAASLGEPSSSTQ